VRCDSESAIRRLREFYGVLAPPPSGSFQFVIWEILSRDSLEARRDLAWQALRRIPALTPDAVFRAPPKALLEALALAGPNREERLDLLRATVGEFKRHRDDLEGERLGAAGLLRAARALRRLAHVDRAMRERALLFVGGYPVVPVDDGMSRVIARLEGTALAISDGAEGFTLRRQRWSRELTLQRRRARQSLAASLPADAGVYREAVKYFRHHAQHTCLAVAPHCGVCPLAEACPSRSVSTPS
jgi:endonuclease III